MPRMRQRLVVRGMVQGVGFRPFVYTLAARLGLAGFVGNDSSGVFIEIEGAPDALAAFHTALCREAPPLAQIEAVTRQGMPARGDQHFAIVHSETHSAAHTLVSPDVCLCADCRRELFDPANRRYRYPFINCTNCGPRFTITRALPYDRPQTTMAAFAMCPACQAEYDNPLDRRFHAQPNACPVCGPHIWLHGTPHTGAAALLAAQERLRAGQIVAVKGLGGFHLACAADHDVALETLRARKGRVDKPFAVMARDVEHIQPFAEVTALEAQLLTNRQRPIVLLKKRAAPQSPLSELIAPGNPYIGVLLPYTPLHELLLEDGAPLVMTSGNFSGEPIVIDNEAALERLAPLADAFLLHNRDIHAPCDDSVVRVFAGAELPLRRSRGYAPFPVKLALSVPTVLAAGAELKNTFCLTQGDHAFMSQHIGDMENLETLVALTAAAQHLRTLFHAEPRALACDMHPRYLATRWAEAEAQNSGLPLLRVQHHHAHIAAVMAENGLDGSEKVIGLCFDGTGYGTDGAIWGGEALIADYDDFRRAGHLAYVPLPGGDSTIKSPCRAALAYLWAAGVDWDEKLPPVAATSAAERRIIRRQLETGFNSVPTSSMGRLFDALAALAGVRQRVTYEAQAALELEALADDNTDESYPLDMTTIGANDGTLYLLETAALLRAAAADVLADVPARMIAAKFHNGLAAAVVTLALRLRADTGLTQVALSGGVFQNVRLLSQVVNGLRKHDFALLTHRKVPPNDGGLALGQAIIASRKIV
ncbi:MAG: carbamoyltransferase HypF [Chloroflexi bacterium]|nr:carbamoyltransferase HypF [Chloroflexota bacterium]